MSFQSCKVTKFPIEIVLDRVDTQSGVSPPSPTASAAAGRRPFRQGVASADAVAGRRPLRPCPCSPSPDYLQRLLQFFTSNHWNNITLQCIFIWHMEIWLKLGKFDKNYWNFDLKLWKLLQHFWGHREAICDLCSPQFIVAEGHNIWKVTPEKPQILTTLKHFSIKLFSWAN